MATSDKTGTRRRDALHRLPGIPAHDRAVELNSSDLARRLHHRSLPNRPLRAGGCRTRTATTGLRRAC